MIWNILGLRVHKFVFVSRRCLDFQLQGNSTVNNGRVASARSNSNGPIRVEGETILRVSVVDCPVTSL